uniref:Retrotransposon Copia-like N-terminal domain-containing protein n=1 Tax=Noccaea caerulescens TaxID=107243 RepID=A0A1J3ERY3_NOCCA
MVIGRKVTRRGSRTTSSARRASTPEASSPISPISDVPLTESPDSIHSPFFLTSGDNPGITIIHEVLDDTNYDNWCIATNIALDAKNKIAFVDGSLPRPIESHRTFRIWSRCNSMVKSWILNSVSKQIYKSILRFNDASEIWNDLQTRYHITNLPRFYNSSQQIWSLQQGSTDLATYYTKLKTLWDELEGADCVETCRHCDCCKATATKAEHAKVIKFLAGLNDSYAVIRSQIIMKKNVPVLSEIYNLLDQDHSQRTINPFQNATAFHVASSDPTTISINAANSNYGKSNLNRPICAHCGYTGHTVDTCYKIHGYPIGFKHKAKQQPEKPYHSAPKIQNNAKPVVAQLSLSSQKTENNLSEMINTLSKDQIQGVIASFKPQNHKNQQQLRLPTMVVL